jgi:hypothetical protein
MPAALLFPTPSRMFTCIRTSKEPLAWLLMISTVLVSILAHGISANPGVKLYARSITCLGPDAPEYG